MYALNVQTAFGVACATSIAAEKKKGQPWPPLFIHSLAIYYFKPAT
jgi:hypothetical protein